MEQYTIYCTNEQIEKALELNAPIEFQEDASHADGKSFIIPTAEQMLGWLEEQDIFIHIDYTFINDDKPYECEMYLSNGLVCYKGCYSSKKEAILIIIDTALDHLINKKDYE